MKFRIASSVVILAAAGMLCACDVDQTEEGELPEVSVEGGNMPEYDVDTADVDVGTEEKEVKVPDVDVDMETETVDVPTIDVDMPDDDDELEDEQKISQDSPD